MSPTTSPLPPIGWRDRLLGAYRRTGWRGFTRLLNLLKPLATRREMIVTSRYGSRFLLNPYDCVDAHVIGEGFYESEVIEALRPVLTRPGVVLWVVGANFGLHAVTAKLLHPTARVIAFEPFPNMAARLVENARINQVEIELHAYALAGKTGVLTFYANSAGNPGMSTLHPVDGFSYDLCFKVATTTPRAVIESGAAPAPNVLLVDAEGAESEILTGFGDLLSAPTLQRLVFEAPNEFLTDRNPADLYRLVANAGFVTEALVRRENTAHTLTNFVALRRTSST